MGVFAKKGIRRVMLMTVIALCVLLWAAIWCFLELSGTARAKAALVNVVFVGFSTNDTGQKCLRYRLRNDNAENVLALSELQNGPPGVFVRLTNSQPQTVDVPTLPSITSYHLQVSCFVEDRGVLTHAYSAIQHFRGQPTHEISKLLFTVSGPVVEP